MTRDRWIIDGFMPLAASLGVWWIILNTWLAGADVWPRGHKLLTPGAPAERSTRHILRPTPAEEYAMATDDSDRITSSHWPAPGQGSPTQGMAFPVPGQPQPPRRRSGIFMGLVALAATLALGAVVAGAYFLGHRSSGPKSEAVNVPAAASASPSPTYDAATLQACKSAAEVRRSTKPRDPEAQAARAAAQDSDQAALREIAQKYDHPEAFGKPIDDLYALSAATAIESWCLYHKLDTVD